MALGKLIVLIVFGTAAILTWKCMQEPELPILDPNPWWGKGEPKKDDPAIKQFKISFSDQEIKDLKSRLSFPLRLVDPLRDTNFTYGFNSQILQTIVDYWMNEYDWKKGQDRLNAVPQFKTQIEGLKIHFLRARANTEIKVKIVPLLLIHGWPGSVVEFFEILPFLANSQEGSDVAFEIICPSLPGFGFSDSSVKEGLGPLEMAQIFLKLMKRLGFEKFYIQAGDWGSAVATNMATLYPENILGVHLNMIVIMTPRSYFMRILGSVLPSGILFNPGDEHKLYPLRNWISKLMAESGDVHLDATKPDTIGVVLANSPVSLAVYILDKVSILTNYDNLLKPDGGLLSDFPLSLDALLDDLNIYWFTNSITTSFRIYAEFTKDFSKHLDSNPCRVPAGLASFPSEIISDPITLATTKFYDIVSYTNMPRCGHFAAMECPEFLAKDVHQFVNKVEKRKISKSDEL